MYNLMIVDDDRLIREDIRTFMDWNRIGYRVVKEASNGSEALDELRKGDVHVVLTDIHMPKMDGVELIRNAKGENASLKFLVMSNYDDFTFVKDAMKYGASDYVLKYRLDKTLLTSLLLQLREEIAAEKRERVRREKLARFGEQGRESLEFKFWLDLLEGNLPVDMINPAMKQLDLLKRSHAYLPIWLETDCGSGKTADILRETWHDADYRLIPAGDGKWIAILLFEEISHLYVQSQSYAWTQHLIETLMQAGVHSVVVRGEVCTQVQRLPQQRMQLATAAGRAMYVGFDKVLDLAGNDHEHSFDEGVLEPLEQAMLNAIYLKRQDETEKRLSEWFQQMRQSFVPPAAVRKYLTLLWHQLAKEMKKSGYVIRLSGTLANWMNLSEARFCAIDEIERRMKEAVERYFHEHRHEGEAKVIRKEIAQAIQYMENHYREEVGLNDVSEFVGLSKNHFCKLFKQETGDNFINYLNRIRVEQAKLCMMQSSQAIKQIADQVGMGNYRYFCKVFKQMTGKRPLDYRNSRMG